MPSIPSRLAAASLFLFLLGWCLVFFHGRLLTSDETLMALTTRQMVEAQRLTFDQEVYGQTFSKYGLGTPIAAIPVFLLDKVFGPADFSLILLANPIIFGLLGVVLAGFLEDKRRWGAVGLLLLASPLFHGSLAFYSEPLAALGLAMLALGIWRSAAERKARGPMGLAVAGAFLAVLARLATGPLCVLVLLWGWRLGAPKRALGAGVAGLVLGAAATAVQNAALRGSPFATGYGGEDFTTPLVVGLFGLLFSPERGLLVFFPALLVPLLGWKYLRGRAQSLVVLAMMVTIFSLVFHARFWTWHGGWTSGPRFLLPALALWMAPVAEALMQRRSLAAPLRIFLGVALAWSAALSYCYARYAAMDWWNQLWGFHQIENLWLFTPQLSLWGAWLQGLPLPEGRRFGGHLAFAFTAGGLALVISSLYPLFVTWRGYLGTDPEARGEESRWMRPDFAPSTAFTAAALLFLFTVVPQLRGPRGWEVVDADAPMKNQDFLLLERGGVRLQGLFDNPLGGPTTFLVKANALYSMKVNFETVLEQREAIPQHLPRVKLPLGPGMHLIEVDVAAKDQDPRFHLYWTWGGEGTFLQPAGGEYILPRELTGAERFFTRIWRRRWMLAAVLLAFLLLLKLAPGRQSA